MSPRRVLLTADAVGGVWRYVLELAHGFHARGTEAVIAVLGPAPDDAQRAEARGIARLIETGLPLDWTAEHEAALQHAARELAGLAQSTGVDLVQLHAPAFASCGAWTMPVVSVAHSCVGTWWQAVRGTALPDHFRWRVGATERGLRASDAVIAPSHALAAALRGLYDADLGVTVVYNGRTPPEGGLAPTRHRRARPGDLPPHENGSGPGTSAPTASDGRVKPGHDDAKSGSLGTALSEPREPAVLTAGRLWDDGKNIAALDRVADRLHAPVYAAGPTAGPNGAAARFEYVRLLGNLDEPTLRRRYAGTAIFASPALYEPFGLGVLEAAQAGMALVLSDIPTFRELWDGAAHFVDPHEDDDLLRALVRLLDDPALTAREGALAQERSRRFTREAMVDGTAAVHRSVLRRRHLAPVA